MRLSLQPPGSAQIHHTQTVGQGFRHPAARLLMRCRQEQQRDATLPQQLPGKGLNHQVGAAIIAGQLRMQIRQPRRLCVPAYEDRGYAFEHWMMEQQARQFHAGVAADPGNCCLYRALLHLANHRFQAIL